MDDLCHYDTIVQQLRSDYKKAIERQDISAIYSVDNDNISGVFLSKPSEDYFNVSPRIMVVGQEPRGWRDKACKVKNNLEIDEVDLQESMNKTLEFARSGGKTSKFFQFYRKVAKEVHLANKDAIIWSNQFCVSSNKKSPVKTGKDKFAIIKDLSNDLLKAQINNLRPDVVIFTTGPSRDKYIKECFPELETIEVIVPRRLWHFKVGSVHCFRITHPRYLRGNKMWGQVIEHVKEVC